MSDPLNETFEPFVERPAPLTPTDDVEGSQPPMQNPTGSWLWSSPNATSTDESPPSAEAAAVEQAFQKEVENQPSTDPANNTDANVDQPDEAHPGAGKA